MSPSEDFNGATANRPPLSPTGTNQDKAMNAAFSAAKGERDARDRAESREVVLTLLFATLTLAFFGWQAQ